MRLCTPMVPCSFDCFSILNVPWNKTDTTVIISHSFGKTPGGEIYTMVRQLVMEMMSNSSIFFSIALSPFSKTRRCDGCLACSSCCNNLDFESSNESSCSWRMRSSGETGIFSARSGLREFPSSIWSATALLSHPRAISYSRPKTK